MKISISDVFRKRKKMWQTGFKLEEGECIIYEVQQFSMHNRKANLIVGVFKNTVMILLS